MLEGMRRHAYSWTTRIILGLITVVFMFWGIGTGFFAQVSPMATVNNTRILPDEVDREASQLSQSLRSLYGSNAQAILKNIDLRQEALNRIIENRLISAEAATLGIHIDASALQEKIAAQSAFKVAGKFDFDTYREVLRSNNLLPNQYEASMRTSMLADTLRHMIDDAVQVSDEEARHDWELRNELVALAYLELPWNKYAPSVRPDARQVADFYKKHGETFREPERVKLSLVHYQPLVLAGKVVPPDRDIESYYKRNLKSRFTHPEMVHARHILIGVPDGASPEEKAAARKKAERLLRRVKRGADFASLAEKYSDDPSNRLDGGDVGFFPRGQMIKAFENAAFDMKPGEVRLVETKFGFHVVRLEARKPAHVDTLAEARPQIVEALRIETGARLARQALREDLSSALDGRSLAKIAAARGLKAIKTRFVARTEAVSGIPDSRKLLSEAFKIPKGEVAAVHAGDAPYLVRLLDRKPSRIPPLKEIETKVRAALVESTAQSKARSEAQKLLKRITSPESFGAVAEAADLAVRKVDFFPRSTRAVPGIGSFPEVTEAAGVLPRVPGVIPRVMEHGGNAYIFLVAARRAPSRERWQSDGTAFTEELLAQRRTAAWRRFIAGLKDRARITVDANQFGRQAPQSSM